jgi:hypothetical protein
MTSARVSLVRGKFVMSNNCAAEDCRIGGVRLNGEWCGWTWCMHGDGAESG